MRPLALPAVWALLVALAPVPAHALPVVHGPAAKPGGHNLSKPLRRLLNDWNKRSGEVALPEHAKDVRYVLVKGLVGNAYPRYMQRSLDALRAQGLDAEFAPIDTGASVAHNSAIIEQMIKTTDRPIVFIGHSKGVADTTDAIGRMAKEDPRFVQTRVRGLVSLEGAYKGSPVADTLAQKGWGRKLMAGLARLVRGSVDAGLDLRTTVRRAAVADHPMPTHLVPTVSFIGYKLSLRSLMAPTIYYLRKAFRLRSDGLVGHDAAVIDGSDYAYGQFDHAVGAFGRHSDRLTLALVSHVLEESHPDVIGTNAAR